jgi:hypothetical protein
MSISKKRLALLAGGVATAGAMAALSLGATTALYSSGADAQSNSITSGTIELTKDTVKSVALNLTGFMPGDTSQKSQYWVSYAGEDAFTGVDLKITSVAQNACPAYVGGAVGISAANLLANCTDTGTIPMFDGDHTAGSLDFSVLPENGGNSHQLFNAADLEPGTVCNADAAGLVTCSIEKDNVILPPHSVSGAADTLVWHNGTTDHISILASLPLAAPNVFQGSNVTIDLTAHAVQFANNNGLVGSSVGTTLPNGVSGTGPQSAVLFPLNWL